MSRRLFGYLYCWLVRICWLHTVFHCCHLPEVSLFAVESGYGYRRTINPFVFLQVFIFKGFHTEVEKIVYIVIRSFHCIPIQCGFGSFISGHSQSFRAWQAVASNFYVIDIPFGWSRVEFYIAGRCSRIQLYGIFFSFISYVYIGWRLVKICSSDKVLNIYLVAFGFCRFCPETYCKESVIGREIHFRCTQISLCAWIIHADIRNSTCLVYTCALPSRRLCVIFGYCSIVAEVFIVGSLFRTLCEFGEVFCYRSFRRSFATLLKLVCRLRPSIFPIYFALNGFASWAKTIHAHMVQDKNRVVNLFIDIYD